MMFFTLFGFISLIWPVQAVCHPLEADKPWLAVHLIDSTLLKNAWSVIRDEQSAYIIQSPQKYIHRCQRTITLLKEGSGEDVIGVPYDQYSTAEILDVTIYDHHGKLIRKVKKLEIIDQLLFSSGTFYQDARALFLKLSGGRFPYTLEYTYEIRYKETMAYSPWRPVGFKQSVEKATFAIRHPLSVSAAHTEDKLSGFVYEEKMSEGMMTRTWLLEKWPAIPEEENAPAFFEVLPMLLIAPSVFQVEKYVGSMNDWKAFGRFLYEINEGREKLTPAMAAKVKAMVAGITDPKEKIDTLYKWLQGNTRYVSVQLGIGGWQSYNAAYVEKNKFGDCKALSTFMKGMLNEVGIEAWQVVIDWNASPTLMAEEFATSYFNHMMLHIPSEDMWLECTSNVLSAGMIDKDTEGKKVLLVTPDGGVLARTPKTKAEENSIHTIDTLYFDQNWFVHGHKKYRGNMQGDARTIGYYVSPSKQREMFLEQFPLSVGKLESLSWYADKNGHEAGYAFALRLNQFGSYTGGRFFIPLNALHPMKISCASGQKRNMAFVSTVDHTVIHDVYVKIPEGYMAEFIPDTKTISHDIGLYTLSAHMEDEYLHVKRTMIYHPARLEAGKYELVCRFYEDIKKADGGRIVFIAKA